MSKKSVFNATKNSYSFYGGFFKDVAQEFGMDKAISMHANRGKDFGAIFVAMLKEELGGKKINLAAYQRAYDRVCQELGAAAEFEKRRSTLRAKVGPCPIYDGCKEAGLDHQTIEAMCGQLSAAEYEEIKKEFPQVSCRLKFRATPDEPCVEEIVLLK